MAATRRIGGCSEPDASIGAAAGRAVTITHFDAATPIDREIHRPRARCQAASTVAAPDRATNALATSPASACSSSACPRSKLGHVVVVEGGQLLAWACWRRGRCGRMGPCRREPDPGEA